ncbi:MAG: DUF4149 domain-containing protein [Vicinamibacterales bacterium]
MIVLRYLYVVALVVWVGGLVAAGALVAPALFAVLPAEAGADGRALAGAAFGEVLRRVLTTGEAAGVVMLVTMTVLRLLGPKPLTYGVRAVLLGAMLAATAYTAHVVLPEAEALRRELPRPSAAASDDPRRQRFDGLHRLSTQLVVATTVAGLIVAAWEARE